ncbi:hypothetical protein CVT24_012921, partial [Panaeolus cyanescens]
MYSLNALVLFLSAVVSVNALTTPLVVRHAHHRAIAARVPAPEPVDVPVANFVKRQNPSNRRCKPRPSSSSVTSSSTPAPPPPSTTPRQQQPTTTNTPPAARPTSTTPPPPQPTTPKPSPTPKPNNSNSGGNNSNLPSFMIGTQTG